MSHTLVASRATISARCSRAILNWFFESDSPTYNMNQREEDTWSTRAEPTTTMMWWVRQQTHQWRDKQHGDGRERRQSQTNMWRPRHQRGHLSSLVGFASVSIWVRVLGSVYRSNITIPFPFSHVPWQLLLIFLIRKLQTSLPTYYHNHKQKINASTF